VVDDSQSSSLRFPVEFVERRGRPLPVPAVEVEDIVSSTDGSGNISLFLQHSENSFSGLVYRVGQNILHTYAQMRQAVAD